MIVRMRFRDWVDAFEATLPGGIACRTDIDGSKSVGFLEVYETLEALHADYPGEDRYLYIEPLKEREP